MKKDQVKIAKNRDIRNILTVLGAAIFSAVLLASAFLYYYSPSGHYIAGNILFDPAVVERLGGQKQPSKKGQNFQLIFDRIEFSYLDPQLQMHKKSISLETYQKFYNLVASEKSLQEVADPTQRITRSVDEFFMRSPPPSLSISMHTIDRSNHSNTPIFQMIQFVQEDYFRVQLMEKQGEWAYFYQPRIYQSVMHLFIQPTDL